MANKQLFVLFAFFAVQGLAFAGTLPLQQQGDVEVETFENSVYIPPTVRANSVPYKIFDSDIQPHGNPLSCLRYVEDAYKAAKEVRDIIVKGVEVANKAYDAFRKCMGPSTFTENVKCLIDDVKPIYEEGKQVYEAEEAIRPKVVDLYKKFEECLD